MASHNGAQVREAASSTRDSISDPCPPRESIPGDAPPAPGSGFLLLSLAPSGLAAVKLELRSRRSQKRRSDALSYQLGHTFFAICLIVIKEYISLIFFMLCVSLMV